MNGSVPFFLVMAVCAQGAAQFPISPDFVWNKDMVRARKAALDGGKPLLVVFR